MFLLKLYWATATFMVLFMFLLPLFINLPSKKWFEKYSSFECGMNLNSLPRKPLSIRFFVMMILFIIFDMEIALILIIPLLSPWTLQLLMFITLLITILSIGMMYEWTEGALNWKL